MRNEKWLNETLFIIKGKERVLVSQERINYNIIYVFPQKAQSKFKYIAEIRSMSEETGHSVLVQAKIDKNGKNISFSLPYITQDISVGIVLKAMGILDIQQLKDIICSTDSKMDPFINNIIYDSNLNIDKLKNLFQKKNKLDLLYFFYILKKKINCNVTFEKKK